MLIISVAIETFFRRFLKMFKICKMSYIRNHELISSIALNTHYKSLKSRFRHYSKFVVKFYYNTMIFWLHVHDIPWCKTSRILLLK